MGHTLLSPQVSQQSSALPTPHSPQPGQRDLQVLDVPSLSLSVAHLYLFLSELSSGLVPKAVLGCLHTF